MASKSCFARRWVWFALVVACPASAADEIRADSASPASPKQPIISREYIAAESGVVKLEFDPAALDRLGWSLAANDMHGKTVEVESATFELQAGSGALMRWRSDGSTELEEAAWSTGGGLLVSRNGARIAGIGSLTLAKNREADWLVLSRAGSPQEMPAVFRIAEVRASLLEGDRSFRLEGQLLVEGEWAKQVGAADAAGSYVGLVTLSAEVWRTPDRPWAAKTATAGGDANLAGGSLGPDIIVRDIYDVENYGFSGSISAFALGTVACNIGDWPASWYANTNEHPVIAQNMYRYKDGRFEQVGMSWLKHGFFAASGGGCGSACLAPPEPGNQLGIGCSDPYSAELNGQQANLGPRSQVNPLTGEFPYPFSGPSPFPVIGRRLQVHNNDLDPNLNSGALYFLEGHYITADDAQAGNGNNNASYRRVTIVDAMTQYEIDIITTTVRQSPAIRAWQDYFPDVNEATISVPDDGLMILSSDAWDLGTGFWHYEYALFNFNSHRGARSFSVPVDPGTIVQNIGFHDVDYHSGEPYAAADWAGVVGSNAVTWSTDTYDVNVNANALRWGTLYNFRFEADSPPNLLQTTIGLFRPGSPNSVTGLAFTPATPPPECGNGSIESGEQCDPPDGVICDGGCQTIANNAIRGGLLWDNWWRTNGSAAPAGDHPLYPPAGQQSGSVTFRCKECHGWDYLGVDGAYGSGTHFTGISGILDTTRTPAELFELIQESGIPGGHGFRGYGLSDQDARDLVQFILDLAIDTTPYIDGNAAFVGDPGQGQVNYTSAGSISCSVCHGADGTSINFGTLLDPEWVGTIATGNPWEFLHKVRFGQPGTGMPSWLGSGGSDQGAADIGAYAQLNLPSVCEIDEHCDDGLFCNGAETCSSGSCLAGSDPCPDQPCDESGDACGQADPYRGGKLYDGWFAELGLPAPAGTHPLYPPSGMQSGSETFRCVECHGWDYAGAAGAYGSGPHFTGIGGVLNSTLTPGEMFDLIKRSDVPNGHGYGGYGLTDDDIWDMAAFVTDLTIDTTPFINPSGTFLGDTGQGQFNYTQAGQVACSVCHGADGTALDYGTPGHPEWIGTTAVIDPWRLLHKIRIGNAGGPMPSWTLTGGSDQGAADIGAYAQQFLPVECVSDANCDDGVFCNGSETCDGRYCVPGSAPCDVTVCDDIIDQCLSGTCAPPAASGLGSRYLQVVPPAGAAPVALWVAGDPGDGEVSCFGGYVQSDGTVGVDPVFQTPAAWGAVDVRDETVGPGTNWQVRCDCGSPGAADLSFPAPAQTAAWCDLDGNGLTNGLDILRMVKVFQLDFTHNSVQEADAEPCLPNGVVNGNDILRAVLSFQLQPYGLLGCPSCP